MKKYKYIFFLFLAIGFLLVSIYVNLLHEKNKSLNFTNYTNVDFNVKAINLGKIKGKENAKGEFFIKNTGNEDLIIEKIEVSCSCSSVGITNQPINPGDSLSIKVLYNRNTIGYFYSDVLVFGNFSTSPEILSFEGNLINEY
jgi:hypothetical protein